MPETTVIKVLVFELPKLLEDIVSHVLEREPEFQVKRVSGSSASVSGIIDGFQADVLLVSVNSRFTAGRITALLEGNPRLKVLRIREDGRQAALYELAPKKHRLGALSPESLVTVIRHAVATAAVPDGWHSTP